MLDQRAFLDRVAFEYVETIKEHWARAWLASLPGCETARAAGLLAPIAAARQDGAVNVGRCKTFELLA